MTMVISTSPANCYISNVNRACHITLLNRKSKFTESMTNIRRKRLCQRCLFRHCSGIVCAKKLLKRRKKYSFVRTRVSQDNVNNFWKFCIGNENDEMQNRANNIDKAKCHTDVTNVEIEDTKIRDSHKDNIQNGCHCNRLSKNVRSVETETDILQETAKCTDDVASKSCTDEADKKQNTSIDCSYDFVNANVTEMSSKDIEASCKEQKYSDNETEQVCTGEISNLQMKNNIFEDNTKSEPTVSNEELVENVDSNKYNYSTKTSRKESQSETSFTETIITDTCMDSILYLELRRKRAPKISKKSSKNRLKFSKSAESKLNLKSTNIKSLQESNTENIPEEEKDKYSLKQFTMKQPAAPINQKKQSDCLSRNCPCDSKRRSRSLWSNSKRESSMKFNHGTPQQQCQIPHESSQPQKSNFLCDNAKLKKIVDSMFNQKLTAVDEKHFIRCETSLLQDKKKPSANIVRDKFVRSRALEDRKFEESVENSSSTSSEFIESSDHSQVDFRCPYKSTANNRHNCNHSSPSSLPSWKRCPSCTVLFEHSVCHKRESVSSSSCTNSHKRRRKTRRRTSSSSTSSTSLVSPLSFRRGYDFNGGNIDRNTRALFRNSNRMFREETNSIRELRNRSYRVLPRLYERGKNRTTYADERHITWGGFERAY
nr:uncharacterized protein LOC116431701 isoform X1 [Nomia melanderi]XP_031843350.1 uncharacterized protein LOC116431701 isoform X1 [Nomia melanderi]XP_031843351.1 uncharacterized protein LOC116431701 isoform X1 [Nomia melanderi]XP_031843352.1 uncharacterized protein LOC116431701 isoform X1 [Nomia melanderi]